MTRFVTRRSLVMALAIALVGALATSVATPALAKKSKSKQSKGRFVKYDPETSTVTIKEHGTPRVYRVKAEGSILTRTTVKINAKAARLEDIPPGAPVRLYWRPDPKDPKQRFARTIDVPHLDEEDLKNFER